MSAKRRRPQGDGTIYKKTNGRFWWIAYRHPDGRRIQESTGSDRRKVAEERLRKRIGAGENNLPVIPNAERLTFHAAAQAMIDDFVANGKKSLAVVKRRINKHLLPFFGGRRLVGITSADVTAFVAKRQTDTIVIRKARGDTPAETKPVSNAEINRELQTLKRIFSLAIDSGRIATKPKITMLREAPARSGFFEREQYESVLKHLPTEIQPVIRFAYLTGWRIASEVLPLEWRNVDFQAGEVRLDAGSTKNGEGRVIHMDTELRTVLEEQQREHERLKKAGHIFPQVFFRMMADERGGDKKPRAIVRFDKEWKKACRAAGCPGRIPHDLRRTAIRNMVRAGIPERVAMMMSGHKTASVFQRYNIVSDGDLREAARKMDVVANIR